MVRVASRWPVPAGIAAILALGAVAPATAQSNSALSLSTQPPAAVRVAGLFDWLLGKPKQKPPAQVPEAVPQPSQPQAPPTQRKSAPPRQTGTPGFGGGTYRTLCVRACDGYYFPISFKATRANFNRDSVACLQRCSGAGARLFVHGNPGQEINRAIDLNGNRYVDLENAFRYREELVNGCDCKAALWAETGAGAGGSGWQTSTHPAVDSPPPPARPDTN